MRSRLRPGLRFALAALLLALPGGRAHADEPPRFAVPEGRPIQLDGAPRKAEWEKALQLPLDLAGTRLYLQQFRGMLMLGFESDRSWGRRSSLTLFFCPDGDKAGWRAPGCVRIDYEPFEHDRAHLIVTRNGKSGPEPVVDRVVARRWLPDGQSGIEMAFGLDVLGVTKDKRAKLRFCAQWGRTQGRSPTWPAKLDLRGRGGPPPDLVSARRWGVLEGWGDPSGPGAFSRKDWKGWIEEAREITRRGREAHDEVRLLREEWKKTRKQDKVLVPAVIDNLRWVGEREPLTANDLFAWAVTLRFLNRRGEALGMFNALEHNRYGSMRNRVLHQRALLHEAMERFDAAARDWRALAARTPERWAGGYRAKAERVKSRTEPWQAEQKARRACEADADLPRVALHTPHGVIEIVLYRKDVPKAVAHFLGLVSSKFYDGTLFHRVEGEFLAQGGDPKSRDIDCESAGSGTSTHEIPIEMNARHGFWRGAVGFARGMRDLNGSQFFLLSAPKPDLGSREQKFTCFGHVVRGLDVVDRLEHCDPLTRAAVLRK